jgi:hypothetical protein
MHPEGRRALRQLVLLGVVVIALAAAFVVYAYGVREWWILAIVLSGLTLFAVLDAARVYRQTKRSVVKMKARGERRLRMEEVRRIATGEPL